LIYGCAKSNCLALAEQVFEKMIQQRIQPTVVTYSSMIDACAKCNNLDRAHELFRAMTARGLQPDVVAYSSLIDTCAKSGKGALEQAEVLFAEMRQRKIQPNLVTYNSLIFACSRAGSTARAEELFKEMISYGVRPNVATYSSRIGSCETVEEAVGIFEEMEEAQISPDGATYCVLIDVCRRCGDEDKANELNRELALVSALDASEKSAQMQSQNNFGAHGSSKTKSKWEGLIATRPAVVSLPRISSEETVTSMEHRQKMRMNAEEALLTAQQV